MEYLSLENGRAPLTGGARRRRSWPVAALAVVAAAAWAGALGAQAPRPATVPPRPGTLQPLPLVQIDERALSADLDTRTFSLTFAQPVPLRDLLLLLVRGTSLSLVPDPSVGGAFMGELKNVSVRQALGLILQPFGLDYSVDGSFVRVFKRQPDTRLFDLNFIATTRAGATRVAGGPGGDGAGASVTSTVSGDVFAETGRSVQTLLSEHGTMSLDRKAGLLQVTDSPDRLDRVASYLDSVHDRVQRQVQIDARVLEVELSASDAQGLDWARLKQPAPVGAVARSSFTGMRVTDVPAFLAALAEQGSVTTLAGPRVLALNNEPAMVRAASQSPGEDITLTVTPQVAGDATVMLHVTPLIRLKGTNGGDAPVVVDSDILARVGDGETIVLTGPGRSREVRERKAVDGQRGGWLGKSVVVTRKRVELVILVTPRVVAGVTSQ